MDNKLCRRDILEQIIYRGEGNSSIVIALREHAKVIRLLKKDGKIMRTNERDNHAAQYSIRSITFINSVIRPLADPFLNNAVELILLKSDFINKLSKKVKSFRPTHRLDKTLFLNDQYALVMDDLCALPAKLTRQLRTGDLCGPTLSVEIKPKQGFLPKNCLFLKSSSSINDQIASIMNDSCFYGFTQILKLSRGRILQTSEYCPVNLFSGCPNRMRQALRQLINNPQNNLKIFRDLQPAFGEHQPGKLTSVLDSFFTFDKKAKVNANTDQCDEHVERLLGLLIQCLLNDYHGKDNEISETNNNNIAIDSENNSPCSSSAICVRHNHKQICKRCDVNLPIGSNKTINPHKLPESCVLSSVLRAQKLDSIGPHLALYMLEWLEKDASSRGENIYEELCKPHLPPGFGIAHQLPHESKYQYYLRKVWEFLVSLTAKDCSIIITLRRVTPKKCELVKNKQIRLKGHLLKEKNSNECYLFTIGLADLDQKMPSKIMRICKNLNSILKIERDSINDEAISL